MLKQCNCKNTFQDETYGNGMRVHSKDKDGNPRCTVCGSKPRWEMRLKQHAMNWLPVHSMK